MLEVLGSIVGFFAFHPLRCGGVAAFFTIAYFIPGASAPLRSVIGIAATAWWAFCALEGMTPPHANVRMDLVFLFPLFIAVAIAGVMAIVRVLGDRRRPRGEIEP
jgi:hypothetical protein